jgi:hypothetical protein
MTRIVYSSILIYLLLINPLRSQEILSPLDYNPAKMFSEKEIQLKNSINGSLLLPFFDDFSYPGPFPDKNLWADNYVFINSDYPIHPKTVGVATFDGLNQYGKLYPDASTHSFQFAADFLTSHPIRLDSVFSPAPVALKPTDNIILTFFYQPQGAGNAPREKDSLVVEFLQSPGHYMEDPENPDNQIWVEDLWVSVWRVPGETLAYFNSKNGNINFLPVAIPITDAVYFRKDFRFRFRNYVSYPLTKVQDNYAGNISIWNIDYVTLDYARNPNDIQYYSDIAFAAPAQSALKNYRSMPWSHYIVQPQAYTRNNFDIFITNLDNINYNYMYRYFVRDENNNVIRNYSGGTWNIAPFSQSGYQTYPAHAKPSVSSQIFGSSLTPARAREFKIVHVITESGTTDNRSRNDSIVYRQVFDNYFAYDDGTPENGYGLVGINPKGAVRFVLSRKDTLEAVQFYFNPTLHNQNHKPFQIKIWKKRNPEQVLYTSPIHTAEQAQWLNQFVTYRLTEPIEVSDTIFVGWQQITNDFLSIGFDVSGEASNHLFFNTDGHWQSSIYTGALMIRPVFGPQTLVNVPVFEHPERIVRIYPNPVRDNILHLQVTSAIKPGTEVLVYDINGKIVARYQSQSQLDVSDLPDGIYLLQLRHSAGIQSKTSRFIIAR